MENGFLHLRNAKSLFDKLKHDYDLYASDQDDSYKAFNFFVTAEHLPDWIGDTSIKDKNPYLRISSHLSTGAKHFKVTHSKKNSVSSTAVNVYINDDYVEDDYVVTVLTLTLTEKESKELGVKTIAVIHLADKVLDFWSEYFKQNT